MATFLNIRTTDAGQALLADVHAGNEKLKIAYVAFGSGVWENADHDAMSLTALKHEILRVTPSGRKQEGSEAEISCMLTNEGLNTGFALTEIGIIAQREDGTEVLYMADAVSSLESTWICSKNEYIVNIPVALRIVCSSDSNVEIHMVSNAPITVKELDDHSVAPDAHPDIRYELANHTHTPMQVGLDNLPNAKSDSVTLASSDHLATSKAAKIAYDKGVEALTNANGKAAANHTHTSAQAGLGNLPNAKSDSATSASSDHLATSKAVKTAMDAVTAHKTADDPHSVMTRVEQALNEKHSYDEILHEQVNKLISGTAVGTEGKWKLTLAGNITINTKNYSVNGYGMGAVSYIYNSAIIGTRRAGSLDYVSERVTGFVIGDSGQTYELCSVWYIPESNEVRDVFIHPKHGNVIFDFTIGTTYHFYLFEESTAPEDQQTGELDVVEYFTGSMHFNRAELYFPVLSGVVTYAADAYGLDTSCTISGNRITTTALGFNFSLGASVLKNDNTGLAGKKVRIKFNTASVLDKVWLRYYDTSDSLQALYHDIVPAGDYSQEYPLPADVKSLSHVTIQSKTPSFSVTDLSIVLETDNSLTDIPSVDSHSTLNVGFWNGKNWQSQLLSDCSVGSDGVAYEFKLARKTIGTSNATMVDKVEVLKADRTWQTYSPKWPTVQFNYSGSTQFNLIGINVVNSYTALGYSSEADMLLNAAVRVTYKAKARRLRPCSYASNPLAEQVVVSVSNSALVGTEVVQELTGNVPIKNTTLTRYAGIYFKTIREPYAYIKDVTYNTDIGLWTDAPNAVAYCAQLRAIGGKLWVVFAFKELVYDGDWGDSGWFTMAVPNVVTTTDDNGNAIMTGNMWYDTGIPA